MRPRRYGNGNELGSWPALGERRVVERDAAEFRGVLRRNIRVFISHEKRRCSSRIEGLVPPCRGYRSRFGAHPVGDVDFFVPFHVGGVRERGVVLLQLSVSSVQLILMYSHPMHHRRGEGTGLPVILRSLPGRFRVR